MARTACRPRASGGQQRRAGDSFFVALWHALRAEGQSLPEALRWAAAAAAIAVESPELVPEQGMGPDQVRARLAAWARPASSLSART